MFGLAVSAGRLETRSFEGDALCFAVRFVQAIDVVNAVSERVELGSDPLPLTLACAVKSRELAIALRNGVCDVDDAVRCSEGRQWSALPLACAWAAQWRNIGEFLCLKVKLGKADFPQGERVKGAVHWACESKSAANVNLVCGRADVDVNRIDERGNSGLSYIRSAALPTARSSRLRGSCSIVGLASTGRGYRSSRRSPVDLARCRSWLSSYSSAA
jgi:hypothetical protein